MEQEDILRSRQQGDRLVLTAVGAWTAVHAQYLEPAIEAKSTSSQPVRAVDIDLSQVKPLDTFGAWLIERLARAWSARGAETRILGLPEDYRGLVDEVHDANKKPSPAPVKINRAIVALDTIGRAIVSIGNARNKAPAARSRGECRASIEASSRAMHHDSVIERQRAACLLPTRPTDSRPSNKGG